MTDHYIQVMTAVGSREEALSIARALVDKRLAGCVQVSGPITSVYRWQGRIETSDEWFCMAKTRRELYAEVESAIAKLHSYDTPEILAVPVCDGSEKYLRWLHDVTIQSGPIG
jgi:periplasmic divalent cation tolerance protein